MQTSSLREPAFRGTIRLMGTRIRKMMGYALTDLKTKKGQIEDDRINMGSMLFTRRANVESENSKYLDFLVSKSGEKDNPFLEQLAMKQVIESKDYVDLRKGLHYRDDEEGYAMKNVLVLMPVFGWKTGGWFRYDDPMDYVEAGLRKNPMKSTLTLLESGPFPYNDSYMNSRTGARLDGGYVNDWREGRRKSHPSELDSKLTDFFLKELGFGSDDEAQKFIAPAVPKDVKAFVEFTEIFNEPETVNQLRPVLYSYWA